MLKVRFMNFWPGFNAEESLFYACLNRIVKTRLILVRDFEEKVDIEIESVFPVISNLRRFTDRLKLSKNVISQQEYDERYHLKFNRSPKTQAVKRIWFSGENGSWRGRAVRSRHRAERRDCRAWLEPGYLDQRPDRPCRDRRYPRCV